MENKMPGAVAYIEGGEAYPGIRGTVRFFPRCGGTLVAADVTGLPRTGTGFFAFHIHEGGDCRGAGFPNTGAHYDPTDTEHPRHAGDLPPLLSDHGRAYCQVLTGRFRVDDIIGKTVVIHGGPDDFRTQPSGNAGEKIACGVIRRAASSREPLYLALPLVGLRRRLGSSSPHAIFDRAGTPQAARLRGKRDFLRGACPRKKY